MIAFPSGVRVWLATGHTDMRKGFDGLSLLVQETLKRDPHDGHLFVFRGRRGDLIKVIWHDGQGMCLFSKRLEPRPLPLAFGGRRHRDDLLGATWLLARRDRLAGAADDVAAARRGIAADKLCTAPAAAPRRTPSVILLPGGHAL